MSRPRDDLGGYEKLKDMLNKIEAVIRQVDMSTLEWKDKMQLNGFQIAIKRLRPQCEKQSAPLKDLWDQAKDLLKYKSQKTAVSKVDEVVSQISTLFEEAQKQFVALNLVQDDVVLNEANVERDGQMTRRSSLPASFAMSLENVNISDSDLSNKNSADKAVRHSMFYHCEPSHSLGDTVESKEDVQAKLAKIEALPMDDDISVEEMKDYAKKHKAIEQSPEVIVMMINSSVKKYIGLAEQFLKEVKKEVRRDEITSMLEKLRSIKVQLESKAPASLDSEKGVLLLLEQLKAAKMLPPAINNARMNIEKAENKKLKKTFVGAFRSKMSITEIFDHYEKERVSLLSLIKELGVQIRNLLPHDVKNRPGSPK